MKAETITLLRFRLSHVVLTFWFLGLISIPTLAFAQRGVPPPSRASGGFSLLGDLEVTEKGSKGVKPLTFDLLLYSRSGVLLDRQKVGNNGRYRFLNIPAGDYNLVIEYENAEVGRTQVRLIGPPTDYRQDLSLQWVGEAASRAKATTVSVEDAYDRKAPNKDRFEKAQAYFDGKEYEKAVVLLTQVLADDPQDFQAWSEIGTVYLAQNRLDDAEKSYVRATEVRPTFFRALLNLGKVRLLQKSFDGAVTALTQAVTVQPASAEANYYLGEAYLQVKKGSKAVGYLYEALKLEPIKMADAHLRLAALYNGAGMKDKAASEYEEFLKKKPNYPDRKKLEVYIAANKKP